MEQQPMSLDIRKTTPILTPNGKQIWHSGVILRKASRFLTGTPSDIIIPVDIFYCPETGEICEDGLPEEIRGLIK